MMIFNGVIKCLLRLLKLRFPPSLVPTHIDPIPMGSYKGMVDLGNREVCTERHAAFGTMLGVVHLSAFLEEEFDLFGHSRGGCYLRVKPALGSAYLQAGPRRSRRKALRRIRMLAPRIAWKLGGSFCFNSNWHHSSSSVSKEKLVVDSPSSVGMSTGWEKQHSHRIGTAPRMMLDGLRHLSQSEINERICAQGDSQCQDLREMIMDFPSSACQRVWS